jgi:hypothetical protein
MSSWNNIKRKPQNNQFIFDPNDIIFDSTDETNNLTNSRGRLCNHIIRAHVASFIAKKCNLKINYGQYYQQMKELGIQLFTSGTSTYNMEVKINDNNVMRILEIPLYKNINLFQSYFQTKDFSNYLYNFYKKSENQQTIIKSNKFNNRYNSNNDVFIHIRLGDVKHLNPGFEYYDKALSQISFENGYIASDDFKHEICKKLIIKYNLKILEYDEVETIMFGSTCKNIVLTGGSFSYIIGLFGFFSKVYYLKSFNTWFPAELFYIPDWTEIDL